MPKPKPSIIPQAASGGQIRGACFPRCLSPDLHGDHLRIVLPVRLFRALDFGFRFQGCVVRVSDFKS